MSEAIKIGVIDDFEPEEGTVIEPDVTGMEAPIALFRTEDDEFYALDDVCTHGNASLAEGWVEGAEVECPLHSGKFCLRTGKVLSMPAVEDTQTHKVEVRGDEVWLYPGTSA